MDGRAGHVHRQPQPRVLSVRELPGGARSYDGEGGGVLCVGRGSSADPPPTRNPVPRPVLRGRSVVQGHSHRWVPL